MPITDDESSSRTRLLSECETSAYRDRDGPARRVRSDPKETVLPVLVGQVECCVNVAKNSRARFSAEALSRPFCDLRVDLDHIEAGVQVVLLQELPLALRGQRPFHVHRPAP